MSNPKREELVELLFAKFGYSDVDVKHGDWRALRLVECADAILEWHGRELLSVFSKQGHSGSSAPYVIGLFNALANF